MEAADASVMVWERRIEFGSVWMMMIMYVDLWHQWQEYIGMVPTKFNGIGIVRTYQIEGKI
jgi:predicted solute-binding protein